MGNLIKINIYSEAKNKNGTILELKKLEANIENYNSWLKKNHREDKIECYEEFLQAQ